MIPRVHDHLARVLFKRQERAVVVDKGHARRKVEVVGDELRLEGRF